MIAGDVKRVSKEQLMALVACSETIDLSTVSWSDLMTGVQWYLDMLVTHGVMAAPHAFSALRDLLDALYKRHPDRMITQTDWQMALRADVASVERIRKEKLS